MIHIKLDEIAKKLGKNISEIAEETGLNRNTVTGLFHRQVDGIKFATIEALCQTYHLRVEDVLGREEGKTGSSINEAKPVYRQEAEAVPFTCMSWMMIDQPAFLGSGFGYKKLSVHFQNDYALLYWDSSDLKIYAHAVYQKFHEPEAYESLYNKYLQSAREFEWLYLNTEDDAVIRLSPDELKRHFQKVWDAYERFWEYSLFIDSFDAGADQTLMNEIAKKHYLSVEEVGVLTTPEEFVVAQERELALLRIAKRLSRKTFGADIDEALLAIVKGDEEIATYCKAFDFYRSNYAHIKHIADAEIVEELKRYLLDPAELLRALEELESYVKRQEKKEREVLQRHRLSVNPLGFFQKLTYWREHRKKMNLMGFHLLDGVLEALQKTTGISKKYLGYLCHDELDAVLKGTLTEEALIKRYTDGVMISVTGSDYFLLEGEEARALKDEFDKKREGTVLEDDILYGYTASQGYARGIARVVLNQEDFGSFQDGEILVTGMTRPEFVPIMKRAAGIVTNEGGVTCHAAIVSRELRKPCVIATKFATQKIKTGDLVEVRAHHGSVRILSRA